ncbi:MAG: hypothetical protein JNL39_07310 [Opitutaceae bacterium]|nr:hypothetical protein [Opitutaceae bacterium]
MNLPLFLAHGGGWPMVALIGAYGIIVVTGLVAPCVAYFASTNRGKMIGVLFGLVAVIGAAAFLALLWEAVKQSPKSFTPLFVAAPLGLCGVLLGTLRRVEK